jgi:hypothetical protein
MLVLNQGLYEFAVDSHSPRLGAHSAPDERRERAQEGGGKAAGGAMAGGSMVDAFAPKDGTVADYPRYTRGKDSCTAYLKRLFQERIVMYDGAMGTMIQKHKLEEEVGNNICACELPPCFSSLLLQHPRRAGGG